MEIHFRDTHQFDCRKPENRRESPKTIINFVFTPAELRPTGWGKGRILKSFLKGMWQFSILKIFQFQERFVFIKKGNLDLIILH